MLVLTRHVGQTICIGKDVRITLTKVKGGSAVTLGIDAPKETVIKRDELLRRDKLVSANP
ncbi:carbon storage regulator [Hydrocarboniphaga sp.]|uniref:carbon storage regulator n=1 Tax=Hydrocarboniphaga sp. TaxID=2033016 RepID=UPI003D142B01